MRRRMLAGQEFGAVAAKDGQQVRVLDVPERALTGCLCLSTSERVSVSSRPRGMGGSLRRACQVGPLENDSLDVRELLFRKALVDVAPLRKRPRPRRGLLVGFGARLATQRHYLDDDLLVLLQRLTDDAFQHAALADFDVPDVADDCFHEGMISRDSRAEEAHSLT